MTPQHFYKKGIHDFHIPVMGTAFTVDSPIKVARYGITSVMSIGDDEMLETMRKSHCETYNRPYEEIKKWSDDYRVRRTTAYLNSIQDILDQQMIELRASAFEPGTEITKYFEMLDPNATLGQSYQAMLAAPDAEKAALQEALRAQVRPGHIEVNIMTKLDRDNYDKDGNLIELGSDALSTLRGFAESKLKSGIVFSAGFNRRLYAYCEQFDDFFPDENGVVNKWVIMKVSDYRSSVIQGRFLAKKGIWISEHRIESGLNCGGHAFASDGYLIGPILEEFKESLDGLNEDLLKTCNASLAKKDRIQYASTPTTRLTMQGGIGTHSEQTFLTDFYGVDGTGWGTPFLLVPEVTVVDDESRELLRGAQEKDLYTSEVSPLGVPFNSVRGTTSDAQKMERFENGRPGSPCPKGHLVSNWEFTKKPVCTASRFYQKRKIEQIEALDLPESEQKTMVEAVITKVCLCEDLAASVLLTTNQENKRPLKTTVCPGPNLAYFSKFVSLQEMVGHIYGQTNLLNDNYRPNFMIKELKMYIEHFEKEIKKVLPEPTVKQIDYLNLYKTNLNDGMAYYQNLIPTIIQESDEVKETMIRDLTQFQDQLTSILKANADIFLNLATA
ncbi:hypothetical protein HOH87_01970 [bacterium]|jgi:hypothetical protein|nr:hypothetical protein [bacterium]